MRRHTLSVFPAAVRRAVAALLTLACFAAPNPANANQGDCGQPSSMGADPVASDALAILRTAVGAAECETCVCDVTADGTVAAADALKVLRFAVGAAASLDCLACRNSVQIGSAGGLLASLDGKVRIAVPAGALATKKTLFIEGAPSSALPEALRAGGKSRAWRLGPDAQSFLKSVAVSISRNGQALPNKGVIGATMSMLITVSDGVVTVLDGQRMTVDDRVDFLTDGADLSHFSILGSVPLDVTAKISGIPKESAFNELQELQIRVTEGAGEDLVDARNPSYTDNNFGAWMPANGEISNAALPKQSPGNFLGIYDYICTGVASVNFTPQIRTVYDVVAPIAGAPQGVVHKTSPFGVVLCVP